MKRERERVHLYRGRRWIGMMRMASKSRERFRFLSLSTNSLHGEKVTKYLSREWRRDGAKEGSYYTHQSKRERRERERERERADALLFIFSYTAMAWL